MGSLDSKGIIHTAPEATILIVVAQPLVRSVCQHALALQGFELIVTEDAERGLHAFSERCGEIDLVLADLSMTATPEIDMARRMIARTPHIKIILMTGWEPFRIVPEDVQRTCALFSKPFTTQQLTTVVRKCLWNGLANGAHA
jgi:two-component system, cell cycle sensor histidine kinase and response regulator CckA